ncbi:MAG TPA: hypothetical protein H9700_07100 [Candidatus Eisenbergiella intestinipullorum]|nr:hypothetical protein [Candidatus Eisenbergiella intestinipullorum]
MKRYWPHIVRSTEKLVEDYLAKQVRDPSRFDDGRMPGEIVFSPGSDPAYGGGADGKAEDAGGTVSGGGDRR